MPKNKKRFIDKKKAVTFHLVHRSQHDPLITDENAPQMVLVESQDLPKKNQNEDNSTKRREEQKKYGIFFDDDYDYLQHLRAPGSNVLEWERAEPYKEKEKSKSKTIQLPSSVFASEFEESEGLLRKAAPRFGPRPDLDPEVVAALDDDFDFDNPDNELEDNFMELANQETSSNDDEYDSEYDKENDEDDEEYSDIDSDQLGVSDDEECDKLGPLKFKEKLFNNEETKSKFTEYSLSSSVIRRNEQLTLLDDRFESFYDQYDDTEIGALDLEDIEGHIDLQNDVLLQYAKEFKKEKELNEYDKDWDKERIKSLQELPSDEEIIEMEVEDEKKEKWDCQSILSTYSNIYNHPKIIEEPKKQIKINPKTGIPINVLNNENNSKLTAKSLAKLNNQNDVDHPTGPKSLCEKSVLSTLSVLSIRPKDETKEEKRERKRLLKDYRSERRIERKANTEAFTKEKVRQQKINANNNVNIQGNKIV